ncbi:MAG: molybdopterin molybdotransferase MoeA [Ectothiorhodospiraceae bacterium AqS1]|nr:molybdopterin molybdotransferase MoeA [Ectothiorhodospiraceae bacterium AqS1]
MLSVEEARSQLLARARPVQGSERIDLAFASGRITARDIKAERDVPGHANSAMDGYAVRAADIPAQGEAILIVAQRITAGSTGHRLGVGEAARIFTGAPIPEGADTIAIQENCLREGDRVIVPAPLAAGTFVRPQGNDIRSGDIALAAGTRIRPQEMGAIASLGAGTVEVRRRIRVAILATGDELRNPGEELGPGQIYNSNRFTLLGLLERSGCEIIDLGVVADRIDATCDAIRSGARQADVLITTGGVSVGEEDHIRHAVESMGELFIRKVAVRPGKPIIHGRIEQCDLIGLPGNPVSTLVGFCLFVRPFLLCRSGVDAERVFPTPIPLPAAFAWPVAQSRREFARARLIPNRTDSQSGPDTPSAEIHPRQGSDVLSAATWAGGLVEIPEGHTLAPGDKVLYHSFEELLG